MFFAACVSSLHNPHLFASVFISPLTSYVTAPVKFASYSVITHLENDIVVVPSKKVTKTDRIDYDG